MTSKLFLFFTNNIDCWPFYLFIFVIFQPHSTSVGRSNEDGVLNREATSDRNGHQGLQVSDPLVSSYSDDLQDRARRKRRRRAARVRDALLFNNHEDEVSAGWGKNTVLPKEDQKTKGNVIRKRNGNGSSLGTFWFHPEGVLRTSVATPG